MHFMRKQALFLISLAAAFIVTPPVKSAGIGYTLGIFYGWDIEETKTEFAKAGIPAATYVNPKIKEMAAGLVKTLGEGLSSDSVLFRTMKFADLPPPQCLYYENALEKRDDIALLALCFYGKERLVLLMPFFRADRIEAATLHKYLEEEYGEPAEDEKDAWVERPWYHAGMVPRRYVFFLDLKNALNYSATVAYVDAWTLTEVRNDFEDDKEAAKKAAEQSKKDARKGL
jgi:hypothetical protein